MSLEAPQGHEDRKLILLSMNCQTSQLAAAFAKALDHNRTAMQCAAHCELHGRLHVKGGLANTIEREETSLAKGPYHKCQGIVYCATLQVPHAFI